MKATILERRVFLPLMAFALLGLAATGVTLSAPRTSAQTGAATTTCAAEGADTGAEVADAPGSDSVDEQCGDQTGARESDAGEADGADTDQVQEGDQTSPD